MPVPDHSSRRKVDQRSIDSKACSRERSVVKVRRTELYQPPRWESLD